MREHQPHLLTVSDPAVNNISRRAACRASTLIMEAMDNLRAEDGLAWLNAMSCLRQALDVLKILRP